MNSVKLFILIDQKEKFQCTTVSNLTTSVIPLEMDYLVLCYGGEHLEVYRQQRLLVSCWRDNFNSAWAPYRSFGNFLGTNFRTGDLDDGWPNIELNLLLLSTCSRLVDARDRHH